MGNEQGLRFSVFGFQKLKHETSPLSVQFSTVAASLQISNLKSQIRASQGGRL